MENFEEKFNMISALYNELNDRYSATEAELIKYKDTFCPKFGCGDKLFVVDVNNKDVKTLSVDEIIINKFGVHYREYVSELEFKQFPEQFCFDIEKDANLALQQLNKQ